MPPEATSPELPARQLPDLPTDLPPAHAAFIRQVMTDIEALPSRVLHLLLHRLLKESQQRFEQFEPTDPQPPIQ